MAITFTVNTKPIVPRGQALGGHKIHCYKITGDSSYSAGGYAVTAANLGFDNGITSVVFGGAMGTSGSAGTGLVPQWDAANSKIKLWKGNGAAALTEAAAGDPNGLVLEVVAFGY